MSLARARDSMCRLDVYNTTPDDRLEEQIDKNAFRIDDDSDEQAFGFDMASETEMDDRSYPEMISDDADAGQAPADALIEVNGNESFVSYSPYNIGDGNRATNDSVVEASLTTSSSSSPHATLQSPQYGSYSYSGMSADAQYDFSMYEDYYGDYEEDYNDVFCCFNPWVAAVKKEKQESDAIMIPETSIKGEDSSDKLASPVNRTDTISSHSSSCSELESVDESLEESDISIKPLKGILKNYVAQGAVKNESETGKMNGRRNLFRNTTTIVDIKSSSTGVKKDLRWASMARVTNVPSRQEFSLMERTAVWWQRKDYDEFKKAGRIITRALVEGGTEIWLNKSASVKNASNKKAFGDDHGDSWWCKFGHSRRGLEHITDIEQGKWRQKNVAQSIQSVINEQRKQKIMDREDPFRLATVAYTHTK